MWEYSAKYGKSEKKNSDKYSKCENIQLSRGKVKKFG